MIIESTLISIIIQFITALIDIYGINLPIDDNYSILKELLQVELGVQTIELIFYIWLVFSIKNIKNITLYRYADWFITTPFMLITLMAFISIDLPTNSTKPLKLMDFLQENVGDIFYVLVLNAVMLLMGFLSELFPVHRILFVGVGFIPFAMYFYRIYKNFLQKEKPDVHPIFTRKSIFWYFAVVWGLYGIVAFFPYVIKNVGLNILDLFSKNVFGIMLVYIVSHHATGNPLHKIKNLIE